jgi:hypothetical protein
VPCPAINVSQPCDTVNRRRLALRQDCDLMHTVSDSPRIQDNAMDLCTGLSGAPLLASLRYAGCCRSTGPCKVILQTSHGLHCHHCCCTRTLVLLWGIDATWHNLARGSASNLTHYTGVHSHQILEYILQSPSNHKVRDYLQAQPRHNLPFHRSFVFLRRCNIRRPDSTNTLASRIRSLYYLLDMAVAAFP